MNRVVRGLDQIAFSIRMTGPKWVELRPRYGIVAVGSPETFFERRPGK
jgi:hypothetical protein